MIMTLPYSWTSVIYAGHGFPPHAVQSQSAIQVVLIEKLAMSIDFCNTIIQPAAPGRGEHLLPPISPC